MVDNPAAPLSDAAFTELAALWGVSFSRVCPRRIPAGSPERTLFRAVIEDRRGGLFVLERIPLRSRRRKARIAGILEFLAGKGMKGIVPYLNGKGGPAILEYRGGLWQMAPFVPGVALDRETYLYEKWRAGVLSRFLIELRDRSQGLPFFPGEEPFSLKAYIVTLVRRIERFRADIVPRVRRVSGFLERDFMDLHDSLPAVFCHGDYHPLNIIWGMRDMKAVIDWEFCGMKPEIYDVANMIGCLGMEHPSSLAGGLTVSFIRAMRDAAGFAASSWSCLPEFVVALRFAWLSEWLRKNDAGMIELELDYMDLLIQNRDRLKSLWF